MRDSEEVIWSKDINIRKHVQKMTIPGREAQLLFGLSDRFDIEVKELIDCVTAFHIAVNNDETSRQDSIKAYLKVREAQKKLRNKAFPCLYIGKRGASPFIIPQEIFDFIRLAAAMSLGLSSKPSTENPLDELDNAFIQDVLNEDDTIHEEDAPNEEVKD